MLDVQFPLSLHQVPPSDQPPQLLPTSSLFGWAPRSSTDSRGQANCLAVQNASLSKRSKRENASENFDNSNNRPSHQAMTHRDANVNLACSLNPEASKRDTMQDVRRYGPLNPAGYQDTGFQLPDGNQIATRSHKPEHPTFLKNGPDTSDTTPKTSLPNGNAIVHYLQIPPTISSNGGNLAEFAAQVTCLVWFESSASLQSIEESATVLSPIERAVPDSLPALGYLKWVTTILSTTQVAQNVIILALLFIYRLKRQNPAVKGKPGSEFRLLTVALMLGNKFLDDNTYTNKTWAEVSGIPVQEIHTMEVEFLSHMKYNLYTSKEEWGRWHKHLRKFSEYFDYASRKIYEISARNMAWRPPALQIPNTLPSPPASTSASPPYASSASPTSSHYHQNTPMFPPPHLAPMVPSPAASAPEIDVRSTGRKRSWDASTHESMPREPLNKRPYGTQMYHMPGVTLPGLPVPGYSAHSHGSLSGRNTPVFPAPPYAWTLPGSSGTHTPSIAAYAGALESNSARGSPYSSPLSSSLSSNLPPSELSPSHFLQHRKSPYRPVQNIRTLLVPPPSASLQNPSQYISHDQMHWQPLSKTNTESRQGLVPYIDRNAWPTMLQPNQWPSLVGVHHRN